MIPLGRAVEATHNQVMVCVVPGVLDGHILEKTAVRSNYVVRLGPHLMAMTEHASHTDIPSPR